MQIAPAEIEDGNIEYKRNFINVNNSRLNHLTAQMNWRVNEGNGICYYYLGICDNGCLYENFTQEEIDYSLDILKLMADGCNSYIDIIIINRININSNFHIWFNITIKRKYEFATEYRILIEPIYYINNLIGTNKSKDIYFNTIIHNNEKYLFFECNKKLRNTIEKIIDFNLIINEKFDDMYKLMNFVENNMKGNNIINANNIIFNIIKHNYIPSIGHIVFGFLKQGTLNNGIILYNKNIEIQVLSIHNNYIDCTEASAPATISLRVLFNNDKIKKIKGVLFRDPYQNEQVMPLALNRQELEEVRRQKARDDRKLRRLRRKEPVHQ
jgi:GTPase